VKVSGKVTAKFATRRMRVLWIVMGTLLVVSVGPLWLYHRHVLRLSENKLEDTERIQQQESARAIAGEILQFQSNLREQLTTQRQFMALTGWSEDVEDPTHAPQVSRLLQSIIEGSKDIIYVTAVGREAQGESAGSDRIDNDPFVYATLKRAFTASSQEVNFVSEPFTVEPDKRPALIMSVPLFSDGKFTGMLAAVVSLDRVVARLRDVSTQDRVFFVVDGHRRIVAHTDSTAMISGMDASKNSLVVSKFEELPRDLRTTGSVVFDEKEKGRDVEMIGTYSTIPALQWAVIAQRSMEQVRVDAGVKDLTAEAVRYVIGATFIVLLFGCLFAFGVTLQNFRHVMR
jgi:sensor domain CHASE-containing protein